MNRYAMGIDIGGQDTKIIRVEDGRVADFLMNDKCSAGTGRFLDVMASTLGLAPQALYALAASGGGVHISSMCTVFAESEVISLIGRGETKENISTGKFKPSVKRECIQLHDPLLERKPPCGIRLPWLPPGREKLLQLSPHPRGGFG